MVDLKQVQSSHIHAVGYDGENGDFHVQYQNGSHVIYKDVPENIANDVMGSWSIGSALHLIVRGSFEHEYIQKAESTKKK